MRLTAKAETWRNMALRYALAPETWRVIRAEAERIAAGRGAHQVGAVHLNMAIVALGLVDGADLAERTDPRCCACNRAGELASTYCGSFCPDCLAEHVAVCPVCAADFGEVHP